MKRYYEVEVSTARGLLHQMTGGVIEFSCETYGKYETLEEAKAAFAKCSAEQGLEGLNQCGKKLYYAKYFSLLEIDEGGYIEYLETNFDELDLEWTGYEE